MASTVAQSFASNSSIVGVIGPAGSQEVTAAAPILKKAGLAFVSGSATNVALTNGTLKGYFFRVVPNDCVQGPTDANYMMKQARRHEGLDGDDRRRPGVVLDRASPTSSASGAQEGRRRRSTRESISQKDTDFSSLVAKVGELDEGRVHAVPARVADAALRPAAEVAGQERRSCSAATAASTRRSST